MVLLGGCYVVAMVSARYCYGVASCYYSVAMVLLDGCYVDARCCLGVTSAVARWLLLCLLGVARWLLWCC